MMKIIGLNLLGSFFLIACGGSTDNPKIADAIQPNDTCFNWHISNILDHIRNPHARLDTAGSITYMVYLTTIEPVHANPSLIGYTDATEEDVKRWQAWYDSNRSALCQRVDTAFREINAEMHCPICFDR